MNHVRLARVLSATVLVLALAACGSSSDGSPDGATSSPASSAAARSSAASSPASPSAAGGDDAAAAASPSPSEGAEGAAVALTQSFSTPDGLIGFRYPAAWSVVPGESSADSRSWDVRDQDGTSVLTLSIRPDGQLASPAVPTQSDSQGELPNALDAAGDPLEVGMGPFPGQAVGVNMATVYAVTSATGADKTFGFVSRGDGTMVSFEGAQKGGINTQVDMAAEAAAFARSSRFRNEILPVLQSFTMKPVPMGAAASPSASSTPGSTSAATQPAESPSTGSGVCAGETYTYSNLVGVDCQEATAILQEVENDGTPVGARGKETADYHCFWSGAGEKASGLPDVSCVAVKTGRQLFDADRR